MSLRFPYSGKFYAEQDTGFESEMCPITKVWRKTKRVPLKTWTIYEMVKQPGSPEYQTPRFFLKDKEAAVTKLAEL